MEFYTHFQTKTYIYIWMDCLQSQMKLLWSLCTSLGGVHLGQSVLDGDRQDFKEDASDGSWKNKSRLLKTTLVLMVIVQVEFSLVAGFWVGITYISNEPGDGVYKKLMALVKV